MTDILTDRREMMKSGFARASSWMTRTDQATGVPCPDWQKPPDPDARVIDLPAADAGVIVKSDVFACIADRRSRRKYAETPMSLAELSFVLWATGGVRDLPDGNPALRTVPSAGARHPLDTYLAVLNVTGLDEGIYRYLPLSHSLAFVKAVENLPETIGKASYGQMWIGAAAAVICWVGVPYRSEWRYDADAAKLVLLDVGHICQNLYLAAEAIGCGACGIGAYDQGAVDKLFGADGIDEFIVYYSPIGKVS